MLCLILLRWHLFFWSVWSGYVSWDHMVSTVVRLWAEQPVDPGLIPDRGKIFFFLLQSIQTGSGPTQPPLQYIRGALFWKGGGGHEADCSPLSSTEVKTEWSSTSTPICFVWYA
jgi:hypothetical protein